MNWHVDLESLVDYSTHPWGKDSFVETIDKNYGICLYDIVEERMGTYFCNIGVFINKDNPILIINSAQRYWYTLATTFDYIQDLECLILRAIIKNPQTGNIDFPFILFKLQELKFGFIEFGDSSIYYGLSKSKGETLTLIETSPKELKDSINKRTGEIFSLDDILWFDLKHLNRMCELYNEIIK